MVRRLLESIGVRSELIEHLDQAQLVFDRPWVFWLGLLLAIPFGFWVASRQQFIKQTSKRLFNWLVALRVLLFLLVAWILAGPNLRLDLQLNRKPIVAVLLDQSRSMNLSVGQFEDESTSADRLRAAGLLEEGQSPSPAKDKQLADLTRLDVIKTLTKRSALWDELLKKFDLRFYGLADSIMPMPADDGKKISELPLTADGDGSRISDGVAQVFDASAGAKVAALWSYLMVAKRRVGRFLTRARKPTKRRCRSTRCQLAHVPLNLTLPSSTFLPPVESSWRSGADWCHHRIERIGRSHCSRATA